MTWKIPFVRLRRGARKGLRYLIDYGLTDTLARVALRIATTLFPRTARHRTAPRPEEFAETGDLYLSADRLLIERFGLTETQIRDLRARHRDLARELQARLQEDRVLVDLGHYGVNPEISFVLYALVRIRQPQVLLEAGVANGHSTFFILRALMENGAGRLHSFDILPDVGGLLNPAEKALWSVSRLDSTSHKAWALNLLRGLGPLDFFFFDGADPDPRWIHFLFHQIADRMDRSGLLLTGDAHWTHAFLDFCAERGVRPLSLMALGTLLGIAVLPTGSQQRQ